MGERQTKGYLYFYYTWQNYITFTYDIFLSILLQWRLSYVWFALNWSRHLKMQDNMSLIRVADWCKTDDKTSNNQWLSCSQTGIRNATRLNKSPPLIRRGATLSQTYFHWIFKMFLLILRNIQHLNLEFSILMITGELCLTATASRVHIICLSHTEKCSIGANHCWDVELAICTYSVQLF